ncbi:MAG: pyrroline-5-carboxylate reductase, partial [Clostridium sp.]|nr:pyrroline-5-carboxylate reductase [Clostridium sp.]
MKIGVIGLGNMATAMIAGLTKDGTILPTDIYGTDVYPEAGERAREKYGINLLPNNRAVAQEADILFLVVKPQQFSVPIDEIKDVVRAQTIVVSFGAGVPLDFLRKRFGRDEIKLIRCMPNTPALVQAGMTGVSAGPNVTRQDLDEVLRLLRCFGKAEEVSEHLMDAVVGIGGSAPAYVFLFIEAMADAAVAAGMPRALAYEFAAQTVYGSAKMVLETGE